MAEPFSDCPVGSAVQRCAVDESTRPSYWIEIELVGEDNGPIPWEDYRVVLPDGKQAVGVLDGDGFARLEQIRSAGTCKVTFPNLDRDAWEFVEALPERGDR